MIPRLYKKASDEFLKETGLLIKKARVKIKISQEDLANQIGLSRTSVNNIEHGRQRIMLDTLLMISDILKVSIVDLIPENFDMSTSFDKHIPKDTSDSVKEWIYEVKDK